jgi:molecular chaperone GrpE
MADNQENSQTISELDERMRHSASSEPSASGGPSLEELQATLTQKTDEVQSLQDKYLRLAAEFDNYKKLAQRERSEAFKFANENILRDLLSIVDNLERAVRAARDTNAGDALMRGVELTLKQFTELLNKYGVQPVPTVGTQFDPARHQAVARVDMSDIPANQVIEEFQKGYLLHDRILRAAMVSVATPPAISPNGNESNTDDGAE